MREMQFRGRRGLSIDAICAMIDCSTIEIERALTDLQELGFIKPAVTSQEHWMTTIAGNALANAKFSKPVSRKVAERNLEELISRAEAVNEDPDLCFWVNSLILFGSLLDPNIDPVGDVDVAVELEARYPKLSPKVVADQRLSGSERTFRRYLDYISWPQREVLQILKGKSRVISLADWRDPILNQAASVVAYRRPSLLDGLG